MVFLKKIRNSNISIKKAEEEQNKFQSNLGEITSGNRKYIKKYQLDTIKNAKNLYDSRQNIKNLLNDNSRIRSEALYETKGTGLKILTSKSKSIQL